MINKKITIGASLDPTKATEQFSITQLCEKIENGDFILPIFQTFLRWTTQKQASLFNYQLLGKAAVSAISVNIVEHPDKVKFVQQVKFLTRELINANEGVIGKFSVADGQQRLTTNYLAYAGDSSLDKIVLDLRKGEFIIKDDEPLKNYQVPVTILYNKDSSLLPKYVENEMAFKSNSERWETSTVLSNVRMKWQKYYYSVNKATDMSEKEQQDWFSVLNLAGSRITQDMVFLSSLLLKGVDFYVDFAEPFKAKLTEFGYESLFPRKSAEVSVPLAALNAAFEKELKSNVHILNRSPLPSDTQPKGIAKLTNDQIKNMFSTTLQALDNTLKFLQSREIQIDRIDYITNIIGYFVFSDNRFNDKSIADITSWIDSNQFTNKSNGERRYIYQQLILKTGNIISKKAVSTSTTN